MADDGIGLRPRADSPGVGLGMPLIADLADRVEITGTRPGYARSRPISPSWAPPARTAAPSRAISWAGARASHRAPHGRLSPYAVACSRVPASRCSTNQSRAAPLERSKSGDVGVEVPAGQQHEPLRLARPLVRVDRQVRRPSGGRRAATTISSGVGEMHGRYVPGSYSRNISTLRSVHLVAPRRRALVRRSREPLVGVRRRQRATARHRVLVDDRHHRRRLAAIAGQRGRRRTCSRSRRDEVRADERADVVVRR